ncbi:MAG TPA: hypothetical protein VIZ18_01615, partial [Ktedonobacteraceae bacterium]
LLILSQDNSDVTLGMMLRFSCVSNLLSQSQLHSGWQPGTRILMAFSASPELLHFRLCLFGTDAEN